jgi:hypothetical protein
METRKEARNRVIRRENKRNKWIRRERDKGWMHKIKYKVKN